MPPTKKKIIAIVGATNAPGRGLVRAILRDPAGRFAARVVTLDVNTEAARALATMGAELVVGHVGAGAGLQGAFTGAYGAFCVPLVSEHPSPQRELTEITAIAQAAKEAGLQHVIWATLGEAKSETAKVFGGLGVPTTFLHAFGDPAKLRGERVAEEMGRVAYGILKTGEYVGKTVSINAELLTGERKPTPPVPVSVPVTGLQPKSGFLRARVMVPLIGVLAVGAFFLVRGLSPTQDPNLDPTASGGAGERDPAVPPPPNPAAADPPPKVEPMAPTVTSKWEQERAAPTTGNAPAKKIALAAPPAPPKYRAPVAPPKNGKAKRRGGRSEPEEVLVEAPPPSARSEERERATPQPPPSASAEAPPAPEPDPPSPSPSSPPSNVRRPPAPAASSLPPGAVDPKAVKATVNAHAAQIRTCFERATMEHPELHGRLTIQATLDASGHVLSATPTSTIYGGARLQACVVSAFQSWTFPAPAGGVKGSITYSFSFE
jgi:hypothetical protein